MKSTPLCLVCSSGGHFVELYSLRRLWESGDRFWVTFRTEDTIAVLAGEKTVWAHHPTNRSLANGLRNLVLALRVLRKERPRAVISTGAGVAVPFFYAARLLRIPTIYIESMTRTRNLSLTGRLVYPVAGRFLVQWPALSKFRSRIEYRGQVL